VIGPHDGFPDPVLALEGRGGDWGAFTCVGWQVTLCDPTWQVMPRSSVCLIKSYTLPFFNPLNITFVGSKVFI